MSEAKQRSQPAPSPAASSGKGSEGAPSTAAPTGDAPPATVPDLEIIDDYAILDIDDDEMGDERWLWVKTARENVEHLEVAHEVVAELGADSIRIEQFAGRAALILLELERRASGFFAGLSARRAARYLRDVIPYGFDGPAHRIMSVEDSLRRGYWACADASAAAAAAYFRSNIGSLGRGRDLWLYRETIHDLPSYARAMLIVDGHDVQPWADASAEARECILLDDVSGLLRARPS